MRGHRGDARLDRVTVTSLGSPAPPLPGTRDSLSRLVGAALQVAPIALPRWWPNRGPRVTAYAHFLQGNRRRLVD
jgi:hypothetical protein